MDGAGKISVSIYIYIFIYIYTPPEYSRSSDMIVLRGYIFYLHGHLFRFMLQAAMEMTAKQTKAGDHSGGFGCVYIYNSTSGNTVYLYALTASCALLRLMISEEEFLARSLTSWPLGCLTWTSFRLQKVTQTPKKDRRWCRAGHGHRGKNCPVPGEGGAGHGHRGKDCPGPREGGAGHGHRGKDCPGPREGGAGHGHRGKDCPGPREGGAGHGHRGKDCPAPREGEAGHGHRGKDCPAPREGEAGHGHRGKDCPGPCGGETHPTAISHRPRPCQFSHRPRPGRWPRPRRFIHRPRRFSHRPRPRQFSLHPARPCQWMRF